MELPRRCCCWSAGGARGRDAAPGSLAGSGRERLLRAPRAKAGERLSPTTRAPWFLAASDLRRFSGALSPALGPVLEGRELF